MLKINRIRSGLIWFGRMAVLALASPVMASAPSEMEFTKDLLARIQKLAPNVVIEVSEPLSLRVMNGPQAGGQVNFDRVKEFCEKNDAALCEEQKEQFASGIAAALVATDDAVTKERLRVVVRSHDYTTQANAEIGTGNSGPLVTSPLVTGLDLVLAADFPETTRLVNEGDLKALGLTQDQAISLGTKQVLAAMPPLPDAKALASSVSMISGQDYGASYLLAFDQWQSRAKAVTGVLWIAVPADERIVIGVARSEKELSKLKPVVAQDYATAPRGISPLIFRWIDGRWIPLE